MQQQTATADVLKVISRSTFDCRPCSTPSPKSAARLCDAEHVWLYRLEGDVYRWAASYGHSREEHERVKRYLITLRVSPGRGSAVGRAALEGRPVQIVDVLADPEYAYVEAQKLANFRTILGAPLMREGVPIGSITLQRTDVRPFTDKQIELVTTFADQAVRIAAAADGDIGGVERHLKLAWRIGAGVPVYAGQCRAHLWRQVRGVVARRGRRFQVGCDAWPAASTRRGAATTTGDLSRPRRPAKPSFAHETRSFTSPT